MDTFEILLTISLRGAKVFFFIMLLISLILSAAAVKMRGRNIFFYFQ